MRQDNKNEFIFNKMEGDEISSDGTWTKRESVQVLWFFVIAFVMLLAFGYLVNRFLL